jgi:hypothetical protein
VVLRRVALIGLMVLLALVYLTNPRGWRVDAAGKPSRQRSPGEMAIQYTKHPLLVAGQRSSLARAPAPAIEPYVRPEFARQMRALRATILEAAGRHNRPELSHMSDHDFAVVIALLLYNENFGSLEEQVTPLRALTPFYQDLQTRTNEISGGNLSVWPANLRPSVALEILRHQVPVPHSTAVITEPINVAGSRVNINAYPSRSALYAAITQEIAEPHMAVEYLAANLERGLYRARIEGVPVTWRTLAAWHNQGIVSPKDISANATAHDYVRRTSAYLATARALVDTPKCRYLRCRLMD